MDFLLFSHTILDIYIFDWLNFIFYIQTLVHDKHWYLSFFVKKIIKTHDTRDKAICWDERMKGILIWVPHQDWRNNLYLQLGKLSLSIFSFSERLFNWHKRFSRLGSMPALPKLILFGFIFLLQNGKISWMQDLCSTKFHHYF